MKGTPAAEKSVGLKGTMSNHDQKKDDTSNATKEMLPTNLSSIPFMEENYKAERRKRSQAKQRIGWCAGENARHPHAILKRSSFRKLALSKRWPTTLPHPACSKLFEKAKRPRSSLASHFKWWSIGGSNP
ncbi:hypothetical protein [Gordonibacter sp. An230]|uniref:hypothetical protein n=1 Tax=Gordonibacter sp. An230 TaxID=1965592 RepID=UPI00112240CC|nr:hypothetical protein [Gordonibacter sp. An230]